MVRISARQGGSTVLKLDFLKRLGFLALTAPLAALQNPARADAASNDDPIVGLWEGAVHEGGATYDYIWSIARGAYVATGNVDENYEGFKYGPSMGTYKRNGDGSYRYRERSYVFDLRGRNAGSSTSTGTFRVSADGNTLTGPGTYIQYDLKSKETSRESFTINAKRISP
ncbi:MAG TPA: hypothetical protein VKE42_06955 [Candidatus Cybelea sp.]|nr:hypothetical protein [Candidatus Cybelea sp.]